MTPIDRLADVVTRMTAAPWVHRDGGGVRAFYERQSTCSYRLLNAHTPENATGIATLRNVAAELIAVADATKAMRFWANEPCLRCDTDSTGATCTCTDHLERLKQAERRADMALTALDSAINKAMGESRES